ncbi:MAG: hypothetical protein M1837_005762 [Sclerophora amabilis]|nr:MAG: hypothetical protein M1837_005762 [Sclerophora amabilis]
MSTSATNPSRTATNTSEDTVHSEDPSGAASLLLERLQAWKHACAYLESYIGATEKIQRAHSKEYERVVKSISDPLKEGHHFDHSVGGVAGLFENMRSKTQAIANSYLDTEKHLKGTVLPVLARLHTEIKNKSKELSGGAAKGSKSVDKARTTTQKHLEFLGQQTASFDSSGGKGDPTSDPYILQRGIYHRLNKQIIEENNNRQDLLAVQSSFQQFEAHVIQTFQEAMGSFLQVVGGQAERTRALYGEITGTSQRMPLDFEWKGFLYRNSEVLIDPNAPPRSIDNVSFPNRNHRATQPLIEGSLERKSRLMKSYSTGYYVVTPSKYLHEFKDTDNFRKDPTPELSLYLPDCTIGATSGPKFNVKGKDTSKGKLGNSFSTTHELAFKAHTPQDAEAWAEVIRSATGSSSVEPYAGSGSNSPVVEKRQGSGGFPPEKTAAPQVQTQGLQQQQQDGVVGQELVTSPTSASTGPASATTGPASASTAQWASTSSPQSAGAGPAGAADQKLPIRGASGEAPEKGAL